VSSRSEEWPGTEILILRIPTRFVAE